MGMFNNITPQISCLVFFVDQLIVACPKNQEMIICTVKMIIWTLSDEMYG